MATFLVNGTLIDGVSDFPAEGQSIWIEAGRIKAVGPSGTLPPPLGANIVDVRGKYVIPGLMDANVHLVSDVRLEHLVRYENRYEALAIEAAQVALKAGLTT